MLDPPEMITSLERSLSLRYPSSSRDPMSPVHNHPSLRVRLVAVRSCQYPCMTTSLRQITSPVCPQSRTPPSDATIRTSTPDWGSPADTSLPSHWGWERSANTSFRSPVIVIGDSP